MVTLTKMSTEDIVMNHVQAFARGDVAALLADYAEDAVFFTPEGVLHGKREIGQLFKQLLADFPPGSAVEISQQLIDRQTAYLVWHGESEKLKIPFATDSLFVQDGKITVQTFAAQVESKVRRNGDRGQVNTSAAEVYEAFFVPALFQEWASRVAEAAQIKAGQDVLDVACGTGVLSRAAATLAGPGGKVVGLDINPGMLEVARQKAPDLTWQNGPAEAIPFDDNSFDAVVSQFGLMFFEDRRTAIEEMVRVLRPGGRLAVAVWDSLDHTPAYATIEKLLQDLFGDDIASALRAPFNLGNSEKLAKLFAGVGLFDVKITTIEGTGQFESIKAWITTEIKGWTLADRINEAQFQQLLSAAENRLQPFVTAQGTVAFTSPAHIVTAVL